VGVVTTTEHENLFVEAFVIREKRGRYSEFLGKEKRRGEILNRLNHFFDFDPALATQVDRGTGRGLGELLRKLGAPKTAYIIGGGEADGRELPLEEAIDTG
jgi:hypothetical protein